MTSYCNEHIFQKGIVFCYNAFYFVLVPGILNKVSQLPELKVTGYTGPYYILVVNLILPKDIWVTLFLSKNYLSNFWVRNFFLSKVSDCRVEIEFSAKLDHVVLTTALDKVCTYIQILSFCDLEQL